MTSEQANLNAGPVAAILAGGLATRLRPVTTTTPKSMMLVAGEPFVAHQLRMLARSGISEVVLLCGFLGEQIESYVQDGSAFGCRVRYSYDGAVLLGTGGALRKALPLLGPSFMVMYGDSYCRLNYLDIYDAFVTSGKLGLMTIFRNDDRWDRSNVEYRNRMIVRYDKVQRTASMEYIDYGVNVFSAEAFSRVPEAFDLALLQTELLRRDQLAGHVVSTRFYEIGSHEGLAETDVYLRQTAADLTQCSSGEHR
jgi:NDP-sugar pyrophosphorylase family protein